MSEAFNVAIPDTAFDETPESVETPAPEAPAVTPEAPAAPAADAPVETPEQDKFDRAYVEQLRQESAQYRTKAKELASAFEGIDDADQAVFKSLMAMYKDDPATAAKEMSRLAQGLLGVEAPEAPAATPDLKGYMTEARYNEIRQQESLDAATRSIEADARGLGYDLAAPEYQYLLAVARTNGGDIKAAHASIEAKQQDAVAKYVAGKEQEAAGAPSVPAATGAPVSGERSLKTWRDVEAAIDELF